MTDLDLENFIARRNEALRRLDVTFMRESIGVGSDEMALVVLHKTRYEVPSIEPVMRHESGRWLRERGYQRTGGLPLLPDGELPK